MNMKVLSSGSDGNCYVLENDGKMFLLDVGLPKIEIMKGIGFRVADVEGIFVSHVHL